MSSPPRTLLHNARLLDLETSAAVEDSWLLLEDGKIAESFSAHELESKTKMLREYLGG